MAIQYFGIDSTATRSQTKVYYDNEAKPDIKNIQAYFYQYFLGL